VLNSRRLRVIPDRGGARESWGGTDLSERPLLNLRGQKAAGKGWDGFEGGRSTS